LDIPAWEIDFMDYRARDPEAAGLLLLETTEEFLSAEEYIIKF
jgi:hypothetical protein